MNALFEKWRSSGREIADLRDEPDEQYYPEDYPDPVPGRLYVPGAMEKVAEGWMVTVANHSEIFADLAEAEKMLWDEFAEEIVTYEEEHR
jgi:hypothetical protein